MSTAAVFNIQRFCLHDGPGIRTTVFMKGCPLRCVWCHNPESMDHRPETSVADQRCIGCEMCLPVCSAGLTGPLQMDSLQNRPTDQCERCGLCAEACPTDARQMLGRNYDVSELVAEALRDGIYQEESRGGVTFSGGEPLSYGNAQLVLDSLSQLKREGVHTVVDTCGHVDPAVLEQAARLTDLFLFDLKIMDPQAHLQATGRDNGLIKSNLEYLLRSDCQVEIRVPMIPGFSDDQENLGRVGRFLQKNCQGRSLPLIRLLRYHNTASEKYRRLGRIDNIGALTPLNEKQMNQRADRLRNMGFEVSCGG